MTEHAPADRPATNDSRVWATFKKLLRARVTSGLVVVLPIYITFLLVKFIFELMRDSSQWLVYWILRGEWLGFLPASWQPHFDPWPLSELQGQPVQWGIAIFSVFLTIFILYVIGLLTANIFGRRVLDGMDRLVDRVPLAKTFYRASKQILQSFSGDQTQNFQRCCVTPFFSDKAKSIGFITNAFNDPNTGEELVIVFVPTTPNPTSGFFFIVRRKEITELNWTVEEGFKAIMSAGLIIPENVPFTPATSPRTPIPAGSLAAQRT